MIERLSLKRTLRRGKSANCLGPRQRWCASNLVLTRVSVPQDGNKLLDKIRPIKGQKSVLVPSNRGPPANRQIAMSQKGASD
jgi:hypothetical protein